MSELLREVHEMKGYSISLTSICILAVMSVIVSVPAHAAVWDVAADFSTAANPNGAWSY
jgi:hypothetical protein